MTELVIGTFRCGPVDAMEMLTVTITAKPVPPLSETPDAFQALVDACRLGDVLGNDGWYLLHSAAELIERFAPHTAQELRRKADAEAAAIALAEAQRNARPLATVDVEDWT